MLKSSRFWANLSAKHRRIMLPPYGSSIPTRVLPLIFYTSPTTSWITRLLVWPYFPPRKVVLQNFIRKCLDVKGLSTPLEREHPFMVLSLILFCVACFFTTHHISRNSMATLWNQFCGNATEILLLHFDSTYVVWPPFGCQAYLIPGH